MDLIAFIAVVYAATRGVEAIVGDTKKRYRSKVGEAAVRKVAASGVKNSKTVADFDARKAAPRSASMGSKAAAGVATGVETAATFWKSFHAGYAAAWPTAREQARQALIERAERRAAERDAKAANRRAAAAEKEAEAAREAAAEPDAGPAPDLDVPDFVKKPDPVPDPAPAEPPAPTPALVLVKPSTAPEPTEPHGEIVTIPEVRTLDGLLHALNIVKAAELMRAEEAEAVAAGDAELSSRLDAIEAQLADLDVDPGTRAEVAALREKIAAQSVAAREYGTAAQHAADLAAGAADAAHKAHGGIAEAVQSSPIEAAAQAGYYNR